MPPTFAATISLDRTSPTTFTSLRPPGQMGNGGPIAFGGATMALAVAAGCATVPTPYNLYSVLGHFLGPARTDRPVHCAVAVVRSTRTFETRRVEATQTQDDGTSRACLSLTLDFMRSETLPPMREYSAGPRGTYAGWAESPTMAEVRTAALRRGAATPAEARRHETSFSLTGDLFEQRPCESGILAQNLMGVAMRARHTQEGLPLHARTSGDWFRVREGDVLRSRDEHAAALAFMMDAALAFVPLMHSHSFWTEAGACSTLDFALRVFVDGVDMNRSTLR